MILRMRDAPHGIAAFAAALHGATELASTRRPQQRDYRMRAISSTRGAAAFGLTWRPLGVSSADAKEHCDHRGLAGLMECLLETLFPAIPCRHFSMRSPVAPLHVPDVHAEDARGEPVLQDVPRTLARAERVSVATSRYVRGAPLAYRGSFFNAQDAVPSRKIAKRSRGHRKALPCAQACQSELKAAIYCRADERLEVTPLTAHSGLTPAASRKRKAQPLRERAGQTASCQESCQRPSRNRYPVSAKTSNGSCEE